MIVKSISSLEPTFCRAVVINVSTKEVSTLAVLSALRYSSLPILLIDLESTDGSWEYFSKVIALDSRVSLYSAPLVKHGYTLDRLFRESRDMNLLLIDSDLEIRNAEILNWMLKAIGSADVFGAGAVHGPTWLGSVHGMPEKVALYQERMWIPLTLLKVQYIKGALEEGYSFINRWVPNELCSLPWLSKALSMRFFVPGFKKVRADFLRGTRRVYRNEQPNIVCCDTGADIFCHLRYDIGARFIDFGIEGVTKMAHHYHGVTRRRLNKRDRNAIAMDDIMSEVLQRLQHEYGVELEAPAL